METTGGNKNRDVKAKLGANNFLWRFCILQLFRFIHELQDNDFALSIKVAMHQAMRCFNVKQKAAKQKKTKNSKKQTTEGSKIAMQILEGLCVNLFLTFYAKITF